MTMDEIKVQENRRYWRVFVSHFQEENPIYLANLIKAETARENLASRCERLYAVVLHQAREGQDLAPLLSEAWDAMMPLVAMKGRNSKKWKQAVKEIDAWLYDVIMSHTE